MARKRRKRKGYVGQTRKQNQKTQKILINYTKEESFWFTGTKDAKLYGKIWSPNDEWEQLRKEQKESIRPRAVVHIVPGATDHIGRYEKLAKELNEIGIVVSGLDLRHCGHNEAGGTASLQQYGWDDTLADIWKYSNFLDERFQNIPRFVLGFSLGSFLVRDYFRQYEDPVDGIILIGTGTRNGLLMDYRTTIIDLQIQKYGFDTASQLTDKWTYKFNNKYFENNKSDLDWFCSDDEELQKVLLDKKCKKSVSSGLLWQTLHAIKRVNSKHTYERYNKWIPILLMSGEKDPIGEMGIGLEKIKEKMMKCGIKNVQILGKFENSRHDLLHEEKSGDAAIARKHIKGWILQKLNNNF